MPKFAFAIPGSPFEFKLPLPYTLIVRQPHGSYLRADRPIRQTVVASTSFVESIDFKFRLAGIQVEFNGYDVGHIESVEVHGANVRGESVELWASDVLDDNKDWSQLFDDGPVAIYSLTTALTFVWEKPGDIFLRRVLWQGDGFTGNAFED